MSRLAIFLFLLAFGIERQAFAQSNDQFSTRLALTGANPTAVSNNARATREDGEPNHAGAATGRSLWYTWTAPTSGTINLSSYAAVPGAPALRALAVYTGDAPARLTEVASSNDRTQASYLAGAYTLPQVLAGASLTVPVTAGTVYQIAVDAVTPPSPVDDDGTVILAINAPPTILSAASVTGTAGADFSYTIIASAGPTAFGASDLPAGLVINSATGLISGAPAAAGTYVFGVSATGPGGTGTGTVTLRVADSATGSTSGPAAPTITSAASARGYVGVAFSFSFVFGSQTGSFTVGNLPPGLQTSVSASAIFGTPTTAGIYSVPITATGPGGTGTGTLTIAIYDARPLPIITSALAATATVGSAFSYSITTHLDSAAAGIAPTAWTASNLPPGVALPSSSRFFTGVPTTAGTYAVPITATNPAGTRQAVVTITVQPSGSTTSTVAPAPPVLGSFAVASGVAGVPFSYTLTASNAPASFATASLPPGLNLNPSTGTITGTPTAAGTYAVPVTAVNSYGTSTGTLTLAISESSAAQSAVNGAALPTITSPATVGGYIGTALSYSITAAYQGNTFSSNPPWTFTATGLPPGLNLTTGTGNLTGSITGTPTTAGVYTATLSATYQPYTSAYVSHPAVTSTATVTFVIKPALAAPLPVITSAASVAGVVGTAPYYATSASGSPTGYAASGLPPGLSISASSGRVAGVPTTAGTFPATVSATNSAGTGSATVTFVIAPLPLPVFPSEEYATRSVTVGYSDNYTFTATNQPTGYAASGLPPGMTFNPATGLYSGTATTPGVYPMSISATNAAGTTTVVDTITIGAVRDADTITGPAVVSGIVGGDFYQVVYGNITSGLPPGLSFNGTVITGKPSKVGSYPVTITSGSGPDPLTAIMTINVANPAAPDFVGGAALTTTLGSYFSYSVNVNAVGTTFAFNGLPPGVTADPAYPGYFSGTPTQAGTYRVGITASNVSGSFSVVLTILVNPNASAPNFGNATPLERIATVGVSDSLTLYTAIPATGYSVTGLPPGLNLDPVAGVISGVPTTVGAYQALITATNASGSGSVVVTYAVRQPVVRPPVFEFLPMSAKCLVGSTYTASNTTASNNPTSYTASGLPDGLSINAVNGTITGKPTTAGRYRVNLAATNPAGTGTAVWTLNVRATSTLPLYFGADSLEMTATVGQDFYKTFYASLSDDSQFASDTISYSIAGLPAGFVVSGNSFQGTPTTPGSYPLKITGTASGGSTASESVLLLVVPGAVPVITSAAGASGTAYTTFAYGVTANGSVSSYGCGALPDGLSFNPLTGIISGTPTTAGLYTLTVAATNPNGTGSATVTLRIDPPLYGGLPLIASAAAVGSQDFPPDSNTAGSFLSPVISYRFTTANQPGTLSVGNLPAGMVFNPSSGILSGTPVAAGTYRLPVNASNASGTVATTLTIIASSPRAATRPALAYGGYVGGSFSTAIDRNASPLYLPAFLSAYATGGGYSATLDPVLYSAAGLPPGLGINSSTGIVTGTPGRAGVYPATITATNRGGTGSAVTTFTITDTAPAAVAAPSLIAIRAEAAGFLGVPMSFALSVPGATTFAATGLPSGLSINPSTGLISGTPLITGTTTAAVTAGNSAGSTQAALTVIIEPAPPAPAITGACVALATVGSTFSYGLTTSNYSGLPAPTGFASGPLPAGLSLNAATGIITGTPTGPAGTFVVPVVVSVGGSTTVNATVTIVVQAPPPTSLLASAAGALGLTSNPFSYVIRNAVFAPAPGATLPPGLGYDATGGMLTGYPSDAGTTAVPLASPAAYSAVTTLRILVPDLSLPRFRSQPVGGTRTTGATLILDAGAVGVPAPACQWYHNGAAIPGAIGTPLVLGNVGSADTGDYVLTASNAAGNVTSTPATLLVLTTYGRWQIDHFTAQEINAGLANDNVSFSGDGVPNLLKYALGLDPRAASYSPLPVIVGRAAADGSLQIEYERDAGRSDIGYLVESSTDLGIWTVIAQSTAGNPTTGRDGSGGVLETVDTGTSFRHVIVKAAPPAGPAQYLRLRVVRP